MAVTIEEFTKAFARSVNTALFEKLSPTVKSTLLDAANRTATLKVPATVKVLVADCRRLAARLKIVTLEVKRAPAHAYKELLQIRDAANALLDRVKKAVVKEKEDEQERQNLSRAAALYGPSGSKFTELTGHDKLNKRQKEITDELLKKSVHAKAGARTGVISDSDLKVLAQKAVTKADELSKTKYTPGVDAILQKSETLKNNVVNLQYDDWTIVIGEAGKGSWCDKPNKQIVIDPSKTDKQAIATLAHETGHANFKNPPDPKMNKFKKGVDYVRKCVENDLLDEGEATLIAARAKEELDKAGETGTSIPGEKSGDFSAIYAKIGKGKGKITIDQARREMGKKFGELFTSNTGENYIDYYSKQPRKDWNASHPKDQVPATPRVKVFI